MDRRTFIVRSGSTLAAVSAPTWTTASAAAAVKSLPEMPPESLVHDFTDTDWLTIATVQNHLFPSEADAPGAVEINALNYLHDFLSNPVTDPEDVKFILSGTQALQNLTLKHKHRAFADLSIEQRENVLREFEQQHEGRRWLVNILNYILEALLTDPVYGGNPEGVGWKWLEHRPGEPRPPANKRYWLL